MLAVNLKSVNFSRSVKIRYKTTEEKKPITLQYYYSNLKTKAINATTHYQLFFQFLLFTSMNWTRLWMK